MKYFLFLLFLCFTNLSFAVPDEVAQADYDAQVSASTLESLGDNPAWTEKVQEVLINALSLTGVQYKYGGNSPETGFDCSGFVRYVFQQATSLTLPPTARAISQIGKSVRKEDLKPGDLVFFNTLKSAFSHVGIYIGDNKFIHSPSAGKQVRVENMQTGYWATRFNGAQRLDKEVVKTE